MSHSRPNFCIIYTNGLCEGCSLWTRTANRAAENGVFYGFVSESDCMAVCLSSSSCVAADLGPYGCVIHNNIDDLVTTYNSPGVNQFVLNRHCLSTTVRPTTSTATVAADSYTTSIGINICFFKFARFSRKFLIETYLSHCNKLPISAQCPLI